MITMVKVALHLNFNHETKKKLSQKSTIIRKQISFLVFERVYYVLLTLIRPRPLPGHAHRQENIK